MNQGKIPERPPHLEYGAVSIQPAQRWEWAMVSGNGRMGATVLGQPHDDTIIANHCRLFLPLGSREILPDLAQYLTEIRRTIKEKGYGEANRFMLEKAKEQGFPGLIRGDLLGLGILRLIPTFSLPLHQHSAEIWQCV